MRRFFLLVRKVGWKVISKLSLFLLKFVGVLPELNLYSVRLELYFKFVAIKGEYDTIELSVG